MSVAVSIPRASWLLFRLRVRRGWNQIISVYRYRMGSADRKVASRTSPTTWLITVFVAIAMIGSFTNLARQGVTNIEKVFGSAPVRIAPTANKKSDNMSVPPRPVAKTVSRQLPPAPGSVLSAGVLRGVTFIASLLVLAALLIALASREIARPEWDLEWLVTLPLPLSTLLLSRLVERAATSSASFIAITPFLSVVAWDCGYRWSAPLVGLGLTVPFLFLLAIVQSLYDTGLRLSLSPSKLRNLQAAVSVISMPPMFLAMSAAMPGTPFVFGWMSATPDWMNWLPAGLAVRTLAASDGSSLYWFGLMVAEIALVVVVGFVVLYRQLRNGVVAAGAREGVVRVRPAAPRPATPAATSRAQSMLSPVQRRELLLLTRDRTFMVQTLLLPALMVGAQVFMNSGSSTFASAAGNPANVAAIAFGLAASTLMFSAFQTLNAEGQALWILYCVPQPLESVLWQKAKMWAVVAAVYPAIVLTAAIVMGREISWSFAGMVLIVVVGVPIFATIATALGVFACDPLEQEVQKRVRITHLYLYMLLASLYVYSLYASFIWQRLALIVLTALLAMALWQKARDQFDYLLDPAASPPHRVSVSDGLIAALMFFVLQGLVLALQLATEHTSTLRASMIWIAFGAAGAMTYCIMRLVYWRTRAIDVPRMLGPGVKSALLWGLAGGSAAAIVGVVYLKIVLSYDLFPGIRQAATISPDAAIWIAGGAVIAAPIFEEFIFRGLIFGGLRRSLNFPIAAIASAAIFAIVHPPASVIPVFVLGFCAALIYEWKRMLIAPMTVHAVYNAAVLGFQWNAGH